MLSSKKNHDLVSRIFLEQARDLIEYVPIMFRRKVLKIVYITELQNRGLPHIHCVIEFDPEGGETTAEVFDEWINATIPSQENPELGALVQQCMTHHG